MSAVGGRWLIFNVNKVIVDDSEHVKTEKAWSEKTSKTWTGNITQWFSTGVIYLNSKLYLGMSLNWSRKGAANLKRLRNNSFWEMGSHFNILHVAIPKNMQFP